MCIFFAARTFRLTELLAMMRRLNKTGKCLNCDLIDYYDFDESHWHISHYHIAALAN
jgi:hypothetical protein